MKLTIIPVILLLLLGGCAVQESKIIVSINESKTIAGTKELLLTSQDLKDLGLSRDMNASNREFFDIPASEDCKTEGYSADGDNATTGEHSTCIYMIGEKTQLFIDITQFANAADLNGSYQYGSLHYYAADGLLSENDFGDQSRFRVNSANDYGAEHNPPGVYYYHLWFTKGLYLVHITSAGADVKNDISKIGRTILAKFE